MIHSKLISQSVDNRRIRVEYEEENVTSQHWHSALSSILDLTQQESPNGWYMLFYEFIEYYKLSALYPVWNTFEDCDETYSRGPGLVRNYSPQQLFILNHFAPGGFKTNPYQAGLPSYPEWGSHLLRIGSSKCIRADQMDRISSYTLDEILNMLRQIKCIGGPIPNASWWNNINYGSMLNEKCSEYSEYLRLVYLIPPPWFILQKAECTSWFQLLFRAGLIENGRVRTQRGYKCLADDGHECFSLAELEIDNWLFFQGIEHTREPIYPKHEQYNPTGKRRGDFAIGNTIIEYAGLIDDAEYAAVIEQKKLLCRDMKIDLIVLYEKDIKDLEYVLYKLIAK